MDTSTRTIRFDEELQVEAYQFIGLAREFPNHFHDCYVIGLMETGQRLMLVNQQEYEIGPGDLLLFNPLDNHACEQTDGGGMDYRCLNIKPEVMAGVLAEVQGGVGTLKFAYPLARRSELAPGFRTLHEGIMNGADGLDKEELFLLFMQQLLDAHTEPAGRPATREAVRPEVEEVCAYLERHYAERVSLDLLADLARLNKYTLLRVFTRCKGITPYRYLETIRVNKARELLEQGLEPAEVALLTGFSDQSHFTGYFSRFTGLPPKQYQSIFRELP